ncbi:MAG: Nif3-like dinuclear metal center hexameric protein [Paludibacteraceae bacterium]|nr:Nif3-like dinuclear metal center hexameric protein [Paludibacteraceae bacterium]
MLLRAIINSIESVAPLSYQEEWDNSGMQVGDPGMDVRAVLLTTDVTESVVDEAIMRGCQLIISHHPLLFHGLKQVCGQTPQARCVEKAIRQGIAIYSSHTAMDSYLHGVSGRIAERIGLTDYRILVENGEGYGLGVIGELSEPIEQEELLRRIKERMEAPWIRYTEGGKELVQRIAICGGSGAEFTEVAIERGADVYLTADCKYHEFQAAAGRIMLVDMDHWTSEHFTRDIFRELLPKEVECMISEADVSPIKWEIES